MKSQRLVNDYTANASKLHRCVGAILSTPNGLFSSYRIYQEVPVVKILSSYYSPREKYDWVIADLMLIIECHGQQHYTSSTFGGISNEQALDALVSQQGRDNRKEQAAIDAGYTYISVPYWDINKVNDRYIMDLYLKHLNLNNKDKERIRQSSGQEEFRKRQLEQAKKYRKQVYKNTKEWILAKKKSQQE